MANQQRTTHRHLAIFSPTLQPVQPHWERTCSQKGKGSFHRGISELHVFFITSKSTHCIQNRKKYRCLKKNREPFQDCIKLFLPLKSLASFGFSHRCSSPGKIPKISAISPFIVVAGRWRRWSLQQLPLFLQGTSCIIGIAASNGSAR